MPEEKDTFWWRCEGAHWRDDDTCSHCGGLKPSIALEKIKAGSEIIPTDKNYKMYIDSTTKVYFNHFSESQAVELVTLIETKEAKIGYPGHFYSGIMFKPYTEAITEALKKLKS